MTPKKRLASRVRESRGSDRLSLSFLSLSFSLVVAFPDEFGLPSDSLLRFSLSSLSLEQAIWQVATATHEKRRRELSLLLLLLLFFAGTRERKKVRAGEQPL